ncbi:MAG: AraC family transcriptional regulator [Lentisphaerae bacterium]|nr:AraC family transcriptional regulator [Lentisphaerota bacterium]
MRNFAGSVFRNIKMKYRKIREGKFDKFYFHATLYCSGGCRRKNQGGYNMSDLKFQIGGLFISNGKGRHVTLKIDTTELIFVKSGTLNIRVGEKKYAVSAGQWLIMPRGIEHGGTKDYEKNLSFFFAHFFGGEQELADTVEYGTSSRKEYFTSYFTFLLNEQKTPGGQKTCDLLMKILLNETRRNTMPTGKASVTSNLANEAKRIIDLDFASPLSTSDIAGSLSCNTDYLGRIFRKTFNCTMTEYLNDRRCEEAATLLQYSTSQIKEIAFFCGFNDMPYFRRQFFKHYSVTPLQYRKLHQIKSVNTMNVGIPPRPVDEE